MKDYNLNLLVTAPNLAHARVSPHPRARTILWPWDLNVARADLFAPILT